MTHTVVQILRYPANGVLRIVFQCEDPGLIETGDLIQGHVTAWWLASYPVIASHAQHEQAIRKDRVDAADVAWQDRQDRWDKVADHVEPPEDGWVV